MAAPGASACRARRGGRRGRGVSSKGGTRRRPHTGQRARRRESSCPAPWRPRPSRTRQSPPFGPPPCSRSGALTSHESGAASPAASTLPAAESASSTRPARIQRAARTPRHSLRGWHAQVVGAMPSTAPSVAPRPILPHRGPAMEPCRLLSVTVLLFLPVTAALPRVQYVRSSFAPCKHVPSTAATQSTLLQSAQTCAASAAAAAAAAARPRVCCSSRARSSACTHAVR